MDVKKKNVGVSTFAEWGAVRTDAPSVAKLNIVPRPTKVIHVVMPDRNRPHTARCQHFGHQTAVDIRAIGIGVPFEHVTHDGAFRIQVRVRVRLLVEGEGLEGEGEGEG